MNRNEKQAVMNNILIVEDDQSIQDMLLYILQKEDYQAKATTSAEEALLVCQKKLPDLILLDIALPGMNGYQFCEVLNTQVSQMPLIIMLTDQTDISDIEKSLNHFADDFIAKPFNPRVLVARIKANLRRSHLAAPTTQNSITIAELTLNRDARQVYAAGQAIKLQKMEFDILQMLMSSPNRVFSRDEIITYCKGDNYYIADRAIDNQIYKLRKKLGDAGRYLETASGVGYQLSV